MVCPAAGPRPKVEEGKLRAVPQKLTGCRSRVTPKQEEAATNTKVVVGRAAATEKVKRAFDVWLCVSMTVMVMHCMQVVIFIDDDSDDGGSEALASCVILRPAPLGSGR